MTRPLIYAGRLERIFANLIDTLVLFIPASMIALMLSDTDGQGDPVVAPISLLVIFLFNTAYYTLLTSSGWQATLGKRMMNIYVMRTDHRPLTQRDALERFLAYVLPSLPMYTTMLPEAVAPMLVIWLSIFWFAPILTHPQRRGFHDKLCHTYVVAGRLG